MAGIFISTSCNKEETDYIYECSSTVVKYTQNVRDNQTFETQEEADAYCDDLRENNTGEDVIEVQCYCEEMVK